MPLSKPRIHRIATSFFFFLAGLCFASWASRIPDIKSKLHLSDSAFGGILLCLPVGLMVSLPIAGVLVSRYGSRTVMTIAACLYSCILPTLGFASTTPQLMLCLFGFGMAGNLLNISVNTQAVGTEKLFDRPIMASFHGIWSLAGFTGAAIGTAMVHFGILPGYHYLGVMACGLLIVTFLSGSLIRKDGSDGEKRPLFARPDASILSFGLIAFCSMICEGTMFDWSGVYFQSVVKPGKEWVTVGYTAFMSTMAAARFVGDRVAYRLGMKKMLQLSGLLTACGLLIAVIFPYFLPATAGFLLVGAGISSVVPMMYSAAGRSQTMSPGVALAAVSTIGYLGFLMGPPLIGYIAEASSLRISFALIALMGTMIAVIASRLKNI